MAVSGPPGGAAQGAAEGGAGQAWSACGSRL